MANERLIAMFSTGYATNILTNHIAGGVEDRQMKKKKKKNNTDDIFIPNYLLTEVSDCDM